MEIRVCGENGATRAHYDMDEPIAIEIISELHRPLNNFHTFVYLHTQDGALLFGTASWDSLGHDPDRRYEAGQYKSRCVIPSHLLSAGRYVISANGQVPGTGFIYNEENALSFAVNSIGGAGGPRSAARPGIFRPLLQWEFQRL